MCSSHNHKKGKGIHNAENDAVGSWHGIGPFDKSTGLKIKSKKQNHRAWGAVISETVEHLAKRIKISFVSHPQ